MMIMTKYPDPHSKTQAPLIRAGLYICRASSLQGVTIIKGKLSNCFPGAHIGAPIPNAGICPLRARQASVRKAKIVPLFGTIFNYRDSQGSMTLARGLGQSPSVPQKAFIPLSPPESGAPHPCPRPHPDPRSAPDPSAGWRAIPHRAR